MSACCWFSLSRARVCHARPTSSLVHIDRGTSRTCTSSKRGIFAVREKKTNLLLNLSIVIILTNVCGKNKEGNKNRKQKEIRKKSFKNKRDKTPFLLTPKRFKFLDRVINKQIQSNCYLVVGLASKSWTELLGWKHNGTKIMIVKIQFLS